MLQRNRPQTDGKCTERALNLVLANKSLRSSFAVWTAATPHDTRVHLHTAFVPLQPSLCSASSPVTAWMSPLKNEPLTIVFFVAALPGTQFVLLCRLRQGLTVWLWLFWLCKPGWPTSNQKTCMPLLLSSTGIKQVCTTRPGWPLTASNPPVPGSWVRDCRHELPHPTVRTVCHTLERTLTSLGKHSVLH